MKTEEQPQQVQERQKLYVRTPHIGSEYKVCDELTDEVKAVFFNQDDALNHIKCVNMRDHLMDELKILLAWANIKDGSPSQAMRDRIQQLLNQANQH